MNAILRLHATDTDHQAMMAEAAGLLEIALAVQGPGALSATRDHAAHHEAGHALQLKVEGHHVLGVEVYRRGTQWVGENVVAGPGWRVDGASDPHADLSRARILLAGPLAELLHRARPTKRGAGAHVHGTVQAVGARERIVEPRSIGRLVDRQRCLTGRRPYRPKVLPWLSSDAVIPAFRTEPRMSHIIKQVTGEDVESLSPARLEKRRPPGRSHFGSLRHGWTTIGFQPAAAATGTAPAKRREIE